MASRFDSAGIPLIIGGGYGLFLRYNKKLEFDSPTTIKREFWLQARSTEDLDMFLAPEVIASKEHTTTVRAILDDLGYEGVDSETARYWQFRLPQVKQGEKNLPVKVDVLTGPLPDHLITKVKISKTDRINRVRPRDMEHPKLHARGTWEALGLSDGPSRYEISGKLDNGTDYVGTVLIPSNSTYLLMKLTAYRDHLVKEIEGFGTKHALDVYQIIASMSEDEFQQCRNDIESLAADPVVQDVCAIVREYFANEASEGILQIRKSAGFPDDAESRSVFIEVLSKIFAH